MKSMNMGLILLVILSQSLVASEPTKLEFKAGKTYFTQTNLHAIKLELSAVNYLRGDILPINTKVTIVSFSKKALKFKANDKTYTYEYHDQADEDFDMHLSRVLGATEVDLDALKLNETDLKGIKYGKYYKGMTKKGVVLAIGFPPRKTNPDLSFNEFKYWVSRFDTMSIFFDDKDIVENFKS